MVLSKKDNGSSGLYVEHRRGMLETMNDNTPNLVIFNRTFFAYLSGQCIYIVVDLTDDIVRSPALDCIQYLTAHSDDE